MAEKGTGIEPICRADCGDMRMRVPRSRSSCACRRMPLGGERGLVHAEARGGVRE